MILQKFGWIFPAPVVAQIPGELDSLANAKRLTAAAIFVLGWTGQNHRAAVSADVGRCYAGEKHLVRMPQANHNSPIKGDALQQFQRELDWLWRSVNE